MSFLGSFDGPRALSAETRPGRLPDSISLGLHGVAFRVHGEPAPQGSKRAFVVGGRAVLTEASGKVKPWRALVAAEAVEAMGGREPFTGPLRVAVTFRLPKPKSVKRDLPHVRPDLDKLARSTSDALSKIVYADDAQVCEMFVAKVYGIPGADVTVTVIPAAEAVAA